MKTKRNVVQICLLGALLLAWPALVTALTITDNFTNAANWGAPLLIQGTANMSVGSGRMNYTSTSTNHSGTGLPRNSPLLPTTQDWSLKVDVHVNPFTLITNGHYIDVFLGVAKTGDPFNNLLLFEFDRGWWSSPGYDIGDDITINGVGAPELFTIHNLSSPDASLRLDFTAASGALTYYFDSDGSANGYQWVEMGTADLASGTYNMNLSETDTFTIALAGSSYLQTVAAGQAYLSNLEISGDTTFSGHVYCSCDGSPITNALVQIGTNYLATTDSTGSYSFTNVPPGTNAATVTAPKFGNLTNSVVIPSNALVATNDFYLTNQTLVIKPIFDSTITNDANAFTITNAIKSAIVVYKQTIANPICLPIRFVATNDLAHPGSSTVANITISYSKYRADLQANTNKSVSDLTALTTLGTNSGTGTNGNSQIMFLTAANLLAIGESEKAAAAVALPAYSGNYGIIKLDVSEQFLNIKLARLQSVVAHEINEVLGIGGWGSSVGLQDDTIGPLDLFRYSGSGMRGFTTNANAPAYFSIDGGVTTNVFFSQTSGKDYGDWGNGVAPFNNPPQVQDADGGTANPSMKANEFIALDVVGYSLLSPTPVLQNLSAAPNSFTFSWATLPGQVYQVQFATNLTSSAWISLGAPIAASDMNTIISDTNATVANRFYRVIAVPPNP